MTRLIFFISVLIFSTLCASIQDVHVALDDYKQVKQYTKTLEEFWSDPSEYFVSNIVAIGKVLECLSQNDKNRAYFESKIGYLQELLPFATDERCTRLQIKDSTPLHGVRKCYWHELIDPLHRSGMEVKFRIELWKNSCIPNYFIFLETIEEDISLNHFAPFLHYIHYCEDSVEREEHKITFKDGLAYLKGELFDTGTVKTLFVLGTDHEIYVSAKIPLKIHHSTLEAGREVICAGMIKAKEGKIFCISNKSGHYGPKASALLHVIERLNSAQCSIEDLQVKMLLPPLKEKQNPFVMGDYNAESFLNSSGYCKATGATYEWTPLHVAIARDQITLSPEVISNEWINKPNSFGDTPLHFATYFYSFEWISKLLNAGADPTIVNLEGKSPMHIAAEMGDFVSFSRMYATCGGFNYPSYPLFHAAAKGGSIEVLEFLLDNGEDPKLIDFSGRTSLHAAAQGKSKTCLKWLIDLGISFSADANGTTPLHLAAAYGSKKVFSYLASLSNSFERDKEGNTVLHYAAFGANYKMIPHIIEVCPKQLCTLVNSKGESSLHLAARYLKDESVSQLLQMGICANIQNNYGQTPLHYAAQSTNPSILQNALLLKECGADLVATDILGHAPIHKACISGSVIQTMFFMTQVGSSELQIKELECLARENNQPLVVDYLESINQG